MPDERFTLTVQQLDRSPFWQARIFLAGEGGRERWWSTRIRIEHGDGRRRSKAEAERVAERHAADLADQLGTARAVATDTSLTAVAQRMLRSKTADGRRPRAVDTHAWNIDKYVEPFFRPERDVTTIRRADLEAFKAWLRNDLGLAEQSVNNALSAIRQVLKYAWKVEELIESAPMVANVERDKTPKGRALTVGQAELLLGAVDPRAVEARHFLTFVANTGVRKAEALAIRFSWVDWKRRLIEPPAEVNKGGRRREPIVLNAAALEVLRERLKLQGRRQDPGDDRVFRQLKHDEARNSAAERVGLGRVRTHDLRHTLGSLHVDAGATLTEVRDTLGHSTMAMVNHYQHSYLEKRRAVSNQVQIRPAKRRRVDKASATGSATGEQQKQVRIRKDQARSRPEDRR